MTYQPKSYRKFLATSVAAAMVATVPAGFVGAAAADAQFEDIAGVQSWAGDAISYLVDKGAIDGVGNGNFDPYGELTRGQAAKILALSLGLTIDADAKASFEDAKDHWASKYIAAIQDQKPGVINGLPDGSFNPNGDITRQEMAKMTVEAYGLELDESAILNFTDNTGWGKDYVEVLASLGVVEGVTAGKFAPNGKVTRAQSVVFVHRTEVEEERVEVEKSVPEVKSITAINANEIKVEFNKEVDETLAETETNYTIDTVALVAGQDTVELQDDKKSVIIKLGASGAITGGLLAHNNAYEVAVSTNVTDLDGNKLSDNRSKTLLFKDAVKPVVTSVASDESGDVTVTFSERLDTSVKPVIVINEVTVNAANVTVNADGTVTVSNVEPAISSLTKNESYVVVVSGAQDLIGNTMDLVSKTFTYTIVNEAPTVTSIKADGETSIELKFDEALTGNLVDGTTVKVYKGSTLITSVPSTSDNKTFTLGLTYGDVYASTETSALLRVVVEGYKDTQNNVGVKYENNVTLQKDTVKPTVEKAAFDATTDVLTVSFSESLAAELATNYAGNMFVTDVNGVRYDVATAATAATELLTLVDVAPGDEEITFNASEFENGTYYLTIQSGAFTDEANTANEILAQTVSFTVGNSSDTVKPTVSSVSQTVKGQFAVTFSEAVKGGSVVGSATDYTNYQINGQVLPVGSTVYLNAAKTVATITLPEGAVANTGTKLVTVSKVQDLAGNVIDASTTTATLTDNTKPMMTAASINSSNELVVEFSEAFASAPTATDLEVKVNGVTIPSGSLVVNVDSSDSKKYVVTATGYNFATGTITVKTLDDATLPADTAGNTLVVDTALTATR